MNKMGKKTIYIQPIQCQNCEGYFTVDNCGPPRKYCNDCQVIVKKRQNKESSRKLREERKLGLTCNYVNCDNPLPATKSLYCSPEHKKLQYYIRLQQRRKKK